MPCGTRQPATSTPNKLHVLVRDMKICGTGGVAKAIPNLSGFHQIPPTCGSKIWGINLKDPRQQTHGEADFWLEVQKELCLTYASLIVNLVRDFSDDRQLTGGECYAFQNSEDFSLPLSAVDERLDTREQTPDGLTPRKLPCTARSEGFRYLLQVLLYQTIQIGRSGEK